MSLAAIKDTDAKVRSQRAAYHLALDCIERNADLEHVEVLAESLHHGSKRQLRRKNFIPRDPRHSVRVCVSFDSEVQSRLSAHVSTGRQNQNIRATGPGASGIHRAWLLAKDADATACSAESSPRCGACWHQPPAACSCTAWQPGFRKLRRRHYELIDERRCHILVDR